MATQQQLVLEDLAAALTHLGLLIGVYGLGLHGATFSSFLRPLPMEAQPMLQEHAVTWGPLPLKPHPAMHHLVLEEVGPGLKARPHSLHS